MDGRDHEAYLSQHPQLQAKLAYIDVFLSGKADVDGSRVHEVSPLLRIGLNLQEMDEARQKYYVDQTQK